ncbi:undecaprenyl-phosphate galactose phosphotransferase WbaP [Alcaligenaceae bacterium CGII-47]|nr:undecaprenyl-phosphate galactose phosphotransferase WbaP [Alcaligenaceae bacterium CGII-47]
MELEKSVSMPGIMLPARARSARLRVAVPWIQVMADLAAFNLGLWVALGLAVLIRGDPDAYFPVDTFQARLKLHLALSVGCVAWFWVQLRHYNYRRPFWFELRQMLITIFVFAFIDLAISALLKWQISRHAWVYTWIAVLILLPVTRFSLKWLLTRLNLWRKQCVIIGSGQNALDTHAALLQERSLGLDVHYFYHVASGTAHDIPATLGIPTLHTENALWAHTDPEDTHYFIAVEYEQARERDDWIRLTTLQHCRAVSVIPTTRGVPLNSTDMSFIFSHDILILRIHENLRKRSARIIKRTFDIVGSVSLMIVLSPLLAYLWLHIYRDGGQPIYGHERIGRDFRRFKCLKYRSMVLDSQERLQALLANDPAARAEWETSYKLKDDPRVTRIGQFLRRTSLDELPQLWNVLRGDMSLVGPRPVVEDELQRYGEQADYYLMIKPGMTGLWQVSGRSDVDYDTRVYFDAWYVKNWSLWHDIAILFKTVRVVLGKDGAY